MRVHNSSCNSLNKHEMSLSAYNPCVSWRDLVPVKNTLRVFFVVLVLSSALTASTGWAQMVRVLLCLI